MKFINFFAGALLASAAANVLPASDAYAGPGPLGTPNGWTQVGKSCYNKNGISWPAPYALDSTYYKLKKNGTSSTYGIYFNRKNNMQVGKWAWEIPAGKTLQEAKNLTLAEANALLNQIGSDFAKSGRSKSSSPSAGMVESYSSGSQYVHNTNCLGY